MLVVCGCSLGPSAPRASSAPGKSAIVAWLRTIDRTGVSFTLAGRVDATGHEKQGEIQMTSGGVQVVIYDGVLYGAAAGSSAWLEMPADAANFMWPAARLSLVWESILLSPSSGDPFSLARDQVAVLSSGSPAAGGEIEVPPSLHEVQVTLDGAKSIFDVLQHDAADVQPPATAARGNVLSLLTQGVSA